MQQKKLERNYITNLEKLYYFILFLANIQILKIKKIDLNSYFFDKKAKYIFLDKSIKTKVLTIYMNQLKLTIKFFKKPINQISQRYIKKKDYVIFKNIRFIK